MRLAVTKRIGMIARSDDPLFAALSRHAPPGVRVEFVEIGGTAGRHVSRYAVIVDRLSHRVPHYRHHLKAAALAGATVINDPFWSSADDVFFGNALAARLGFVTPRMVMLPQKAYGHLVDVGRDLNNLQYPLDWNAIGGYVSWPAVLEVMDGQTPPVIVDDLPSLLGAYDASGTQPTVLRQRIAVDRRVRGLCIDGQVVLAAVGSEAVSKGTVVPPALHDELTAATRRITEALGYQVSAVDFGLCGSEPVVLRAADPFTDLSPAALGDETFNEVMALLVDLLVELAQGRALTIAPYGWSKRFARGVPRRISEI